MEEFGKENLIQAIGQLKNKKAPNSLWDNIEEELDENDQYEGNHIALQKALSQLPEKKAPISFNDLITHENEIPLRKVHRFKLWHQMGIAASIALLLVSGLYFWPKSEEQISISYSEQKIELNQLAQFEISEEHEQDEVLSFIKANCKAFEQQCNQEAFQDLLQQYMALENDRKSLVEAIKINQGENQLIQYLVRIEKKKTKVGKQLMQTFI